MNLTDEQKQLIIDGKEYLSRNDFEGFFNSISPSERQPIADFIYENLTLTGKHNIFENMKKIPAQLFQGSQIIKQIDLPLGIEHIGDYAFSQCSNLVSIKLSPSVCTMGTGALCKNGSLKEVELSPSLVEIPSKCFMEDASIEYVILPPSVNKVGSAAFSGDTALVYVPANGLKSHSLQLAEDVVQYMNSVKSGGQGKGRTYGSFKGTNPFVDASTQQPSNNTVSATAPAVSQPSEQQPAVEEPTDKKPNAKKTKSSTTKKTTDVQKPELQKNTEQDKDEFKPDDDMETIQDVTDEDNIKNESYDDTVSDWFKQLLE